MSIHNIYKHIQNAASKIFAVTLNSPLFHYCFCIPHIKTNKQTDKLCLDPAYHPFIPARSKSAPLEEHYNGLEEVVPVTYNLY